ncbi:MAG: maleylacetoacetate isomerase [Pseudomonadota bacterium]
MRLYTYWRSTAAYRVRIVLNLKAIAYETQAVNLLQDPADEPARVYRERNPQGLVPALEVDGRVITQSTAIVEFLEERWPQPALLPSDPWLRAKTRALCQLIACDVHPLNNLRVLRYLRGELGQQDAAVDAWYHHWIHEGFAALEKELGALRGRHCIGDEITLCDAFLVPQLYNARRFDCDLTRYPTLVALGDALAEQPAFLAAAPAQQPDAAN